jgi:hypothetical protein
VLLNLPWLKPPWLKTPWLKTRLAEWLNRFSETAVVENAVGNPKETHAPADGATGNIKFIDLFCGIGSFHYSFKTRVGVRYGE